MADIKQFLSKKTVGWYIALASAVMGLITLVIYAARGGDALTKLSSPAIAVIAIGVVLNALLLVKDVKPLEIVPFVLYFVAILIYGASEVNFIANVIYGVDGNAFDPAFFCVFVFGVLAVALGMAASIVKLEKE